MVPVADRNGPPQGEAGEGQVQKLPRRGDGAGIPQEDHPPHIPCHRAVFPEGIEHLLHLARLLSHSSMVEISMVISSSTSSSTRTVSRAVKMVTPFSTAHRRMRRPSLSVAPPEQ